MTIEDFNATSYGALLLGGLMAFRYVSLVGRLAWALIDQLYLSFSGIVAVQSVVYFKLYPRDVGLLKALVSKESKSKAAAWLTKEPNRSHLSGKVDEKYAWRRV